MPLFGNIFKKKEVEFVAHGNELPEEEIINLRSNMKEIMDGTRVLQGSEKIGALSEANPANMQKQAITGVFKRNDKIKGLIGRTNNQIEDFLEEYNPTPKQQKVLVEMRDSLKGVETDRNKAMVNFCQAIDNRKALLDAPLRKEVDDILVADVRSNAPDLSGRR